MAQTYTIDATGKTPGRLASEAAKFLMGKDSPAFARNKSSGNKVIITNASKAKISPKKLTTTMYERYSGYPGGFRYQSMDELIGKKGYSEVFRLAVYGMLPGNKLRNGLMKNLTVTE